MLNYPMNFDRAITLNLNLTNDSLNWSESKESLEETILEARECLESNYGHIMAESFLARLPVNFEKEKLQNHIDEYWDFVTLFVKARYPALYTEGLEGLIHGK